MRPSLLLCAAAVLVLPLAMGPALGKERSTDSVGTDATSSGTEASAGSNHGHSGDKGDKGGKGGKGGATDGGDSGGTEVGGVGSDPGTGTGTTTGPEVGGTPGGTGVAGPSGGGPVSSGGGGTVGAGGSGTGVAGPSGGGSLSPGGATTGTGPGGTGLGGGSLGAVGGGTGLGGGSLGAVGQASASGGVAAGAPSGAAPGLATGSTVPALTGALPSPGAAYATIPRSPESPGIELPASLGLLEPGEGSRAYVPSLGLVRATREDFQALSTPLRGRPGMPRPFVQGCRQAIASAAEPYGLVRIEAAAAGALRPTRDGYIAPVAFRVVYARAGGLEARQAVVTCRTNKAGQIVAAR